MARDHTIYYVIDFDIVDLFRLYVMRERHYRYLLNTLITVHTHYIYTYYMDLYFINLHVRYMLYSLLPKLLCLKVF